MACSGVLGFILLVLLHPAFSAPPRIDNLQKIINYLHRRYGDNNQYALGINVPDRYCNEVANPDQNFLSRDNDAQKVTRDMKGPSRIYNGVQLIGARPKPIHNKRSNYHSEYLLLIDSKSHALRQYDPLMQTLLNSNPNDCAVFFTLNSPCVQTCSTPGGNHSIIPALNMFTNHTGRKAFVFRKIWHRDVNNSTWGNNMLEINQRIPLYRCRPNGCVRCVDNNNVINNNCYNITV